MQLVALELPLAEDSPLRAILTIAVALTCFPVLGFAWMHLVRWLCGADWDRQECQGEPPPRQPPPWPRRHG